MLKNKLTELQTEPKNLRRIPKSGTYEISHKATSGVEKYRLTVSLDKFTSDLSENQ